ncbi:ABC transporter substrate binding protein [Desulfococcaceae bacterium HSG8]|nr:ABC transporter substrate binding protein [Desulfococcaceae bacterium HSG8]
MKRLKILFLICFFVLGGAVAALAADAAEKVKVGVIHILGKHLDHIELRQGFLNGMKLKGYNVEVIGIFDADIVSYPDAYIRRGIEEAKRMEAAGAQLIFCTAMYHGLKDGGIKIPIIDAVFLSPLILKYAVEKNNKKYILGNATGTIFGYSIKAIADFVHDAMPKAKKMAYLYSPGTPTERPESEIAEEAGKVGLKVVNCPYNGKNDIGEAVNKAIKDTDVLFTTNCMALHGVEKTILDAAKAKNFPVITAILHHVREGALVGIQTDWHRAGEMCSDKADKVLKGTPANEIPIEFSDRYEVSINVSVAEKLGIEIPYTILQMATIIE